MNTHPVTVVRIYLREGEHVLNGLVRFLREEQGIAGLTVFRGILGVGTGGDLLPASLVDLSLDLPLVVEFFDAPEKVEQVLDSLPHRFALEHVIVFNAAAFSPKP
jgi:PII-like signaling protein